MYLLYNLRIMIYMDAKHILHQPTDLFTLHTVITYHCSKTSFQKSHKVYHLMLTASFFPVFKLQNVRYIHIHTHLFAFLIMLPKQIQLTVGSKAFLIKFYIFIYIKRHRNRRYREKDLLSTGSFPKLAQKHNVVQVTPDARNSILFSHLGYRGSSIVCCLPRHNNGNLPQRRSSKELSKHSNIG